MVPRLNCQLLFGQHPKYGELPQYFLQIFKQTKARHLSFLKILSSQQDPTLIDVFQQLFPNHFIQLRRHFVFFSNK